jgi:hypothetical protein
MRKTLVVGLIFVLFASSRLANGAETSEYFGIFSEAPPTDVKPQGWLKEMLQRQVDGLAKHHAVSGYPYNTCLWAGKIPKDLNPKSKTWWPYEQAGYLVDGLERLGLVTSDPDISAEALANVNYILNHPQADGSLGPDDIGPTNWPHAVVFRALMAAYNAHPDPAIPQALLKHYLARLADFGTGRDVCNVEEMLWVYGQTNDPRMLQIARRTFDNFNKGKPKTALTALENDSKITEHGVTFNETAKIPALLYLHTGDKTLLDATINAYRKIDRDHMLPSGLHSCDEHLSGSNPWLYHETCDISDYTWSVGYLLMATGDCTWADHIEKTVFNAGLGAITKDFKAHQYFSSPNQVIVTHGICKRLGPNRLAYRPGHDVECCSGNVHRFLPNFALRQWMLTSSGGVVAALYSPSQFTTMIDGAAVTINEQTEYPFSDTIKFVVHTPHAVAFPFLVRIPGWTVEPRLEVNGQPVADISKPGSFDTIQRTFADGDIVTLHLPMVVNIHDWGQKVVSVERGPLVYSLKIDETDTAVQDAGTTSEFPAWDKRPASAWNYALALPTENPATQVSVVYKSTTGCPWDTGNSPVQLEAPAKLITNWKLAKGDSNPGFPSKPEYAAATQSVSLVPYGSTCLRLTAFLSAADQTIARSLDKAVNGLDFPVFHR